MAQTSSAVSNALDAGGLLPVIGVLADGVNAVIYCLQGDFANAGLSAAAMVPVIGDAAAVTKWTSRGGKYLRHIDPAAFNKLLRLGADDWTQIRLILDELDPDTVLRSMKDRAGNQIGLLAGNREKGLKHIIGRHLTGDYSGAYTTYFSETLAVGDVVDIVARTVQNGTRVLDKPTGNWVYTWRHPTWGDIKTVVDSTGEVISAFPTKTK
jgi:hypothetical protein